MSGLYVSLLVFFAVVLLIIGGFSVFMDLIGRDRSRISDRLNDEFRAKQRERAKKTSLFKDLGKLASEAQANEPGIAERFETMIEQSGLEDLTPGKLLGMCIACGMLLSIGGFFVFKLIGAGIGLGVGCYAPIFYVKFKRQQRIALLRSQLSDTFDLMGRVVRAGQTMTQAMQAVTDEMLPPVAIEFALCYEQMNLGIPPEAALRDLARRTGIIELQIFVMALLIQRQTGGNLAEMLDNISQVVRQRFKILGQIQTLTAEGRMQASILLVLPPAMMVMIMVMNPKYAEGLTSRPILIIGMMFFEFVGWLWIRKIVNFDF
jgi:tight adherence protein B